MVSLQNDRPAGTAQVSIPVNVLVRSDFVSAVQSAVKTLHGFGATLPLTGPSVLVLPPSRRRGPEQHSGLPRPHTDDRATGGPGCADDRPDRPCQADQFGQRILDQRQCAQRWRDQVIPDHYDAVRCTAAACAAVTLPIPNPSCRSRRILAAAGFYPASPLPQPVNSADASWATFANVTGLRAGVTLLGDELALLYQPSAVAASVSPRC